MDILLIILYAIVNVLIHLFVIKRIYKFFKNDDKRSLSKACTITFFQFLVYFTLVPSIIQTLTTRM